MYYDYFLKYFLQIFNHSRYEFESLYLHWGLPDEPGGSEHSIDGHFFPGELQLLGFNADLHKNLSDASREPHGLVGIAVLIDQPENGERKVNKALTKIVRSAEKVNIN